MKHFVAIALCLGLLTAVTAQTHTPPSEWQSMKIMQTVEPLFPLSLQHLAVSSGEARVVISVSSEGKLTDWLVVGYTLEPFADSAVRALKQWKFQPARLDGEAVNATSELTFIFRVRGTMVVSQNISENLEARTLQLLGTSLRYKPRTLKELDRIPTPIVVVKPQYPKELARQGVRGKVTVDFYIDEKGDVRMPSASHDDDSRLSALAIAALQQWKFEPPTWRGRPVLVKASQVFDFGGKKAKPKR